MISTTAMEPEIQRPTAASRLHLYLAWGCPFCHRVVAALAITRLSGSVSVTWMRNIKGPMGWEITPGDDPLFDETSLMSIYQRLEPGAGHASVPLLVDMSSKTLLSSSSSQITRFIAQGLNGAFAVACELAPAHLIEQIDSTNAWLHEQINRAVYQVGFATVQADYEAKVARLFQSLDMLETRLAKQPYLLGDALTESDLYLLATLVRFDSVYYPLFKCSMRSIADYPALSGYLERLRSIEGIPATYDLNLIKQHYFCSVMHVAGEIRDLNPSRIIPADAKSERQSRQATAN